MNSIQLDTFISAQTDPELVDLLASAQMSLRIKKASPHGRDDLRELEEACAAIRAEIIRREALVV